MATETTTRRGLSVRCPLCGGQDSLTVRVADGAFHCPDCDGELTPEELESLAREYLRLAAWAKAIPCGEGPHAGE